MNGKERKCDEIKKDEVRMRVRYKEKKNLPKLN